MEGMGHFGWGLVSCHGIMGSSIVYETEGLARSHADEWNENPHLFVPYRAVELFYRDSNE